jgi:WD40 repeat protein
MFCVAMLAFAALSCVRPGVLLGQLPASSACSLPEPPLTANRPNLFNEQQEQWLGDAMAAQEETEYVLLPEKDSLALTNIGQKLLAQLPPTPIHYHFRVYEADDLNGFSLAGGYVYLSRKLIMNARNEDEVAGVLAHEIGHIYTHQIATGLSRSFDKLMHVESFSDRSDVIDKYQRLLNVGWKNSAALDESEQEKDELRADAVGLYAMVRAGYAPEVFSEILERIANTKGRNGNVLSDILGGTSVEGMRVRAARKTVNSASDACKHLEPKSSAEFLSFKDALISHPVNSEEDPTPGLESIALADPVRPGLNWVRFSPDGQYVLAQNETYIYVLSSSPLKQLFKVFAPGASGAHFTPDSKHLVFHYQSLRVEDWDIASQKLLAAHEIFEYRGCWQSELSPDGKILACVFLNGEANQLSLELFDVASGKVVLDKETYFVPDQRAQTYNIMTRVDWDPEWLSIAFSPDSRYLAVVGQTNHFSVDLTNSKPVSLGLGLSQIAQGRVMFTAPDQLLYDCDAGQSDIFRSTQSNVCLVEFPSGIPIRKFVEGWEGFVPVAQGNYVVAQSYFDSTPHLVDLTLGKPTVLLRFQACDVWGKLLACESSKGGISIGEMGAAKTEAVDFPPSPLPYVRVAQFSSDGKYLALSNENRGAIWKLSSNHQIALTRSFRGAWFDDSEQLFLQLTNGQAKPGQNMRVDLKTGSVADTGKYDLDHHQLLDVSYFNDRNGKENDLFQFFDQKTGNLLWKKKYSSGAPAISQEEPGVLVLAWGREGLSDWGEIKHSTILVKSSDLTKDQDQGMFIELVNSQTGAVLRQLETPEGRMMGSSEDHRSAVAYGDMVVAHGNSSNSVVYDAKTGARLMAFWGRAIAGSSALGLIAATNHYQELVVYDVKTGKEMLHVTLDHRVRAAQFVVDKKQLVAVTSNQRVYTFDLSGAENSSILKASSGTP